MHIVSFDEHVLQANGTSLLRGVRYVVNESTLGRMHSQLGDHMKLRGSFNSYDKRFPPAKLTAPKVLVHRHDAFGDQLMATSVVHYIRSQWPDAQVDVSCAEGVKDIWMGCATGIVPFPFPLEMALSYDWHILYEQMFEVTGEPEQDNAYDIMFRFAGLDPDEIPDHYKRPFIHVRTEDNALYERLKLKKNTFIVYQLCASNYMRTYPPELGAEFIRLFLEQHPEHKVVLIGKDGRKEYPNHPEQSRDEHEALTGPLPDSSRIIDLIDKTKKFRSILPLVANAACVVTGDTAAMHAAAAFSTPAVTLWGVFHPADRAKYYDNQIALQGNSCPHAPCRVHQFTVPEDLCKDGPGGWESRAAPYCNALASIQPEKILDAVTQHIQ